MNVKDFFEYSKNYHKKLLNLIDIELNPVKIERNVYNYIERTYFNCGANIGILEGLHQIFKNDDKVSDYFNKKRHFSNILKLNEIEKDKIFIEALDFFKNNIDINIKKFQNFLIPEYSIFAKNFLFLKNLKLDKSDLELLKINMMTIFNNKDFLNKDKIIQSYLSLKYDLKNENFVIDKDTFFNYSLIYKIPKNFEKINYNICFSNFFFLGYSDFKILPKESIELVYLSYFQFFISEIILHKKLSKKYNLNFFDTTYYYEKYFNNENIPQRIKKAIEKDLLNIKLKLLVFKKNNIDFDALFSQSLDIAKNILNKNFDEISQINYCLFKHFHDN